MQLPTYDEIARYGELLEVYERPFGESLFVVGPPGSGKTVLAVRRAQMVASANTSVVLITYSRMLRRLIAQLTVDEVQAKTMHQFVSTRYVRQTKAATPSTAPYVYDWNAMFTTLERLGVKPDPTHVIVDEGQDLPKGFFRYLRDFGATTITVFADEDQALSDNRCTPRDIKEAARLDDPLLLSANHRNTPEIARVAEHFHAGDAPAAEVHRAPSGELPRVVLYRENGATARIANWYKARGGPCRRCRSQQQYGQDSVFAAAQRTRGKTCSILHKREEKRGRDRSLGIGITVLMYTRSRDRSSIPSS